MYDAKADWHLRNATRFIGCDLLSLGNACARNNTNEHSLFHLADSINALNREAIYAVRCCANVAFEVTTGRMCLPERFLRAGNRMTSFCDIVRIANEIMAYASDALEYDIVRLELKAVLDHFRAIHAGYECLLATPTEWFWLDKPARRKSIRRAASVAKWLKDTESHLLEMNPSKRCQEAYDLLNKEGDK